MIFRHILNLLFVPLVIFSLNSCGGGNAITKASAPQVLSSFATVINRLPRGNSKLTIPATISGPSGLGLRAQKSVNAFSSLSCYSASPTVPVDADGDGIPAQQTTTFNCSQFADGASGYTYNQQGFFRITDLNDLVAGLNGGYKYEFNMPVWNWKDLNTGINAGGAFKGFWSGMGTDKTATFSDDFTGRFFGEFDYSSSGLGILKQDFTYSSKSTESFTHDSVLANAAWNTGTMTGSGTFSISGIFLDDGESGTGSTKPSLKTGSASISWKSVDLTFDHTCSTWFKSGKFILNDSSGAVIEVRYLCTKVETYYNGQLLTGVAF